MRTVTFDHPFREGTSLTLPAAEATGSFQVGVNGRGYRLDLSTDLFAIESLDFMRTQQDQGPEAGEQTLSNSSLWRRSLRSWHLGAGQTRGDESGSSPYRFLSSEGINPWNEWKLGLLPAAERMTMSSNSPIGLVAVGSTLCVQAGTTLRKSTDGLTWSLIATISAVPTTLPVSDGEVLYTACNDDQIKSLTTAGIETDVWALANVDVLSFAKGRLWAGAANALYPLTPGSAVTAEFTHPWTGWRWTAICEGPRAVYAGGLLGDKSAIYRVPFKSDGTGFDAATVAATLPDGETITALTSYLGFIMLGTDKGVRFGIPDQNTGDLNYGSLIPTPNPVLAFEAQDKFIWFGWSDYDNTRTGVGRVDLSGFSGDATPAYASDLMWTGSGDVTSIVTFADRTIFTVQGAGVITEQDTTVVAGSLVTSEWTFGLYDKKIASAVSLVHEALDGQVLVSLSVDGAAFTVIAESSTQGSSGPSTPFLLNPVRGITFALELTLVAGAADGPVVTGAILSAKPTPLRGKKFTLPLMLTDQLDLAGMYSPMNPEEEQQILEGLVEAGNAVSVQIGGNTYQAFPVNFRFIPDHQSDTLMQWTGTFVLELDEVTT